jgi:hypothetical protein
MKDCTPAENATCVLSQRRRKRVAKDRTGIAAHIGENGAGGGRKKQGDSETKLAHWCYAAARL